MADDSLYEEHITLRNNQTDSLVSYTLAPRVYRPYGTYNQGTIWTIPRHDLDAVLVTYHKQNGTFKAWMKKDVSSLAAENVETIIHLATRGAVHLEFVVRSVRIPPKPYYLLRPGLCCNLHFLQCLSSLRYYCTEAGIISW